MFKKAIVKTPAKSIVHGLSTAGLGAPNYKQALSQHGAYINALQSCGLEVFILPKDEAYPDSVFIEDIALLTPKCAIITNPGASSRQGEILTFKNVLHDFYSNIEQIKAPGTVEAGDIMMVGSHYYVGLSQRTNHHGAQQIIQYLQCYGLSGSIVKMKEMLHLKTGVAYLEHNNLLACGEFITHDAFQTFNILPVTPQEQYAANCIWVNNHVLMPQGYPKAKNMIQRAGYNVIELNTSEFQKIDGGLSCLSLRF